MYIDLIATMALSVLPGVLVAYILVSIVERISNDIDSNNSDGEE